MTPIAVVDTGPLVAVANSADPDHRASLAALRSPDYSLVIPALCVAEASYLIAKKQGSNTESAFLRGLDRFDVEAPVASEWNRIADLVSQYDDLRLSGTDASVVVLAERLETDLVITLDQRHFTGVRPRHAPRLRLLP